MSKDIWHTKDEIPRQESRVVWKSGNVVCGGRFDTHYKCFCGPASQFVDLKTVSCWAYIDDLFALETENEDHSDKIGKLETELEKTRKALDVAWDGLKKIGSGDIIEHSVVGHENDNKIFIANKALDESKTAIEQKDK